MHADICFSNFWPFFHVWIHQHVIVCQSTGTQQFTVNSSREFHVENNAWGRVASCPSYLRPAAVTLIVSASADFSLTVSMVCLLISFQALKILSSKFAEGEWAPGIFTALQGDKEDKIYMYFNLWLRLSGFFTFSAPCVSSMPSASLKFMPHLKKRCNAVLLQLLSFSFSQQNQTTLLETSNYYISLKRVSTCISIV